MTPGGMSRSLSLLRPTMANGTASSSIILTTLSITAATASLLYTKKSSKTSLEQKHSQEQFRLNVDLMDRINNKPYLPVSQERTVPRRLRLLVIDVPEMRFEGINGECRVNPNKVFMDGIAPPKLVDDHVKVEQKSLAQALVKCRSRESLRIGVEMTEASVAALNPHNVRKTHQFGSYRYDPGKYTTTTSSTSSDDEDEEIAEQIEADDVATVDDTTTATVKEQPPKMKKQKTILATDEDEYDAPWNQYAWIQELQLRIGGKVVFGEPMQPSSRWRRLLFGSVYKTTIPSSRAPWEYLLLPIFHRNPAGHDWPGRKNWASNKPHAVIAHGAAMQRVPGSLRFLQKTCQEEGVPLYIIHDARVWGGNTHQTLPEALKDLRKTVKQHIVLQAMQGGSSFRRGRLLGQAETEAKWQAKDIGRRTRQAVRDANEKLKRERENDWSKLNATELQHKLVGHNVIVIRNGKDKEEKTQYTIGMVELSRKCVADVAEEEGLQEKESIPNTIDAVDSEENGSQPA